MAEDLRVGFHRELEEIDQKVVQLFALVSEGLSAATDAFLAGDREAAKQLIDRDKVIDSLYVDVEEIVYRQLATQSPMAGDLRFLLSVLRIVPELERSGDLAEHIAARAARGVASALTPRIRGLVEQMGLVGTEMWRMAADAYAERDGAAATELNERDDELDELHVSLTAELVSGQLTVPIALEMALVARFYERLGDHAVNIGERIRYIAAGSLSG
ncbi:MAG: phosphate signaling complex protein PhoU [Actinobacteria bacterium]|nr:phosphate signaling complex protein PhoU [Actinomycetota bacterium]MBV8958681.1 phosphate signaling complex protein PhoU [Actinomycetota bacterium]MBV9256050.1 phosphate signaling complex protein PhoU [Actinomycetota bacterium]MBV9665798.1 phosphate signaling complex protein PhoU [Actinomycetota bacterium]MBV9936242.1 phosphate signaling complex protein PhoU [Actinomycetota bacterium]